MQRAFPTVKLRPKVKQTLKLKEKSEKNSM